MALLEAREKFKDLDEKLSKKQQEVIDIRWGE
jgi:hypothetical protein